MTELVSPHNPVLQAVLCRHGIRHGRALRGWVFGRGMAAVLLRLVPVLALAGSIGFERLSPMSPAALAALGASPSLWLTLLPIAVAGLVALSAAAVGAGRDWSEGRIDEWRLTRLGRQEIAFGQVVRCALPAVAGLVVGGLVAAVAWAAAWAAGLGGPPISPVEGILILVEACLTALFMAGLGTLFGNRTRRPARALLGALALGIAFLSGVLLAAIVALGCPLLGAHGLLIGVLWILGREARFTAGAYVEPSQGWLLRPGADARPVTSGEAKENDEELAHER